MLAKRAELHIIKIKDKTYGEAYVNFKDALDAMEEYAKNYNQNELKFTKEVLTEKTNNYENEIN